MAKVVYEVKIYHCKWFSKTEIKGSVIIHKVYKRWVCTCKEYCDTKAFALREIKLCLETDKAVNDIGEYKYSIRVLKGGKKRVKR